jgi:hypothetical protein
VFVVFLKKFHIMNGDFCVTCQRERGIFAGQKDLFVRRADSPTERNAFLHGDFFSEFFQQPTCLRRLQRFFFNCVSALTIFITWTAKYERWGYRVSMTSQMVISYIHVETSVMKVSIIQTRVISYPKTPDN